MNKNHSSNRKTVTTIGLIGVLILALVPLIFFFSIKMSVEDDFEELAEIIQEDRQQSTSPGPIDTFNYYTLYLDSESYIWLEGKFDSTTLISDFLSAPDFPERALDSIHKASSVLLIKPLSSSSFQALTKLLDLLQSYPELKYAIDKATKEEEFMLNKSN